MITKRLFKLTLTLNPPVKPKQTGRKTSTRLQSVLPFRKVKMGNLLHQNQPIFFHSQR
jgi:hypothetical protein